MFTSLSYALTVAASKTALVLPLGKIDPGVKPNTTGLPVVPKTQEIVGSIITIAVVVCVGILVVSVVSLAVSKISKSQMSDKAGTAVIWSIVAATIIGSAGAIVMWATGLSWGF